MTNLQFNHETKEFYAKVNLEEAMKPDFIDEMRKVGTVLAENFHGLADWAVGMQKEFRESDEYKEAQEAFIKRKLEELNQD
jgi:hypothetical protein